MAKKTMSNGKRDFRQWHRISYILLGVGFLMCAVSSIQVVYESPVGKIMSLLGIGFAFASFAVNFLFYRCPKCRRFSDHRRCAATARSRLSTTKASRLTFNCKTAEAVPPAGTAFLYAQCRKWNTFP